MTGVDRDILISRVIDGEATPEDWTAFKALAAREPDIWRDLAETQQDHAELSAAVESAIAVADEIEAPIEVHFSDRLSEKLRLVGRWGGWAAAAALVAIWASGGLVFTPGSGQQAGLSGTFGATPEQTLNQYLKQGYETGRVVAPTYSRVINDVLLDPDGRGYIIFYDLVIPERAIIENPMIEGVNEFGEPVTVPLRPTEPLRPTNPMNKPF